MFTQSPVSGMLVFVAFFAISVSSLFAQQPVTEEPKQPINTRPTVQQPTAPTTSPQTANSKLPDTVFSDHFWTILPPLITAFTALIVGSLTIITALTVGLAALDFNNWSTRRTARQDHIRMLMEIDSRLIENPHLWSVYGKTVSIPADEKQVNKDWRAAQEEALIYTFFNMFEAVYDFHRHLGFYEQSGDADQENKDALEEFIKSLFNKLSKRTLSAERKNADQEYKDAWETFVRDFFNKLCPRSKSIFSARQDYYSKSFRDWVSACGETTRQVSSKQ